MIALLILILMLLLLFDYFFLSNKILLTPSIIALSMFLFSATTVAFNNAYFGVQIRLNTVLVILGAMAFLIFGECVTRNINIKRKERKLFYGAESKKKQFEGSLMVIPKSVVFCIYCFMGITLIFRYMTMFRLSLLGGNPGSFMRAFGYARRYMLNHPESSLNFGTIINQLSVFSECITYIFSYTFFNNLIRFKKMNLAYILTIPLLCMQIVCDTSRSGVMGVICTVVIIGFFNLYSFAGWKTTYNVKIIKIAIISLIGLLFLFSSLAYLTMREDQDPLTNVVKYVGSPLVGLDIYLNTVRPRNAIFGQETLYYLHTLLDQWGLIDAPYSSWHHSFFYYAKDNSNIYTGLRRSIQDYSIFGMLFTRLLIGIVYMAVLKKIIKDSKAGREKWMLVVFICMLYEPIAMMPITDEFPQFISTSTLYKVFYIQMVKYFGVIRNDKLGNKGEKSKSCQRDNKGIKKRRYP